MDSFNKAVSLYATYILEMVGYNWDIVQTRRRFYQVEGEMFNDLGLDPFVTAHVAGSKGEGLTSYCESDLDILHISTLVLCCERGHYRPLLHTHPVIFTLNFDLCSPGYCLLILHKRGMSILGIDSSLVDIGDGRHCFSSKSLLRVMDKKLREAVRRYSVEVQFLGVPSVTIEERAGPSIARSVGSATMDYVSSYPCHCPSILHEWFFRKRPHNWPSWELRAEVLRLGANLCPIGCKDDMLHDHQWRLCFNLGEMRLVHSWNEVQIKLYVVLKMLLKEVLKPENKEITSYVMKNVVFWMCERYPQQDFTNESLMYWVRKSLQMLKLSIEFNFLPYYMIPGRNLLKRIRPDCKQILISRISMIMANPLIVFHCWKIKFGMKMYDKQLLNMWQKKRDFNETKHLELVHVEKQLLYASEREPVERVESLFSVYNTIKEIAAENKKEMSLMIYLGAVDCDISNIV